MGKSLAWAEMKLILAKLLWQMYIQWVEKREGFEGYGKAHFAYKRDPLYFRLLARI